MSIGVVCEQIGGDSNGCWYANEALYQSYYRAAPALSLLPLEGDLRAQDRQQPHSLNKSSFFVSGEHNSLSENKTKAIPILKNPLQQPMKMLWKLTDNIKYEDCEVRDLSLLCFIPPPPII